MSPAKALVLVTTSYPSRGDGSEAAGAFVADLAGALRDDGVPLRVVAPGPVDAIEHPAPGLEIYRFASPPKPLSTLKPWLPADALDLCKVMRRGEVATRAAVGAGPTAHVLALWALPSGHWARRAARIHRVPYSIWTLGSDIWTLGKVPVVKGHLRRVLQEAMHCYSDGLQLGEDTRALGGRDVRFLPSTRRIETRRHTPLKAAPPYRLLFLGRWHPNKGADLLLESLHELRDEDWARISCVEICGGGPLEAVVREQAAALRSAGRPVEVRGFLDKPAAEAAIAAADYLLIPSRIESIPVVFSDAMKLDCPVLAMPVGDLPRLITTGEPCGLVAASVDARAYADILREALTAAPVRFLAGVRTAAGPFDLDACARQLRDELGACDEQ